MYTWATKRDDTERYMFERRVTYHLTFLLACTKKRVQRSIRHEMANHQRTIKYQEDKHEIELSHLLCVKLEWQISLWEYYPLLNADNGVSLLSFMKPLILTEICDLFMVL